MPEKGRDVAIYGMSSEGYVLASSLSSKGLKTTIVDETLHMAMELKAPVASSHSSLDSLVGEEALMGLESMDRSVGRARVVFFTPRIRRPGEEAVGDLHMKLRELSRHLPKGCTFVYGLPTKLGGNQDNISLIEKQAGLSAEGDLNYVYAPLQPRSGVPTVIGASPKGLSELLLLGLKGWEAQPRASLSGAEVLHMRHVVAKTGSITTELESAKMFAQMGDSGYPKEGDARSIFIDDLCGYVFDLRMVFGSLKTGEPLLYSVTGILRSIESYQRLLTSVVKNLMKTMSLRASRTTLHIVWSVDRFEMRGDGLAVRESLQEKLREFASDVQVRMVDEFPAKPGLMVGTQQEGRINIYLACSRRDFEHASKMISEKRIKEGTHLLKANLLAEYA